MNKVLLYLVIGCAALAAQTPLGSSRPDTVDHVLQERFHIALTEEALLGALQRGPSEARGLAAAALAEHGYKDATGPILDALSAETFPGARIDLATSAAQLGSEEGFRALKSMCGDRSWSPGLRVDAARSMLDFTGRQECLSDVLEVLRSAPDDFVAVPTALSLLPKFSQVSPSQLDEMRALSATFLESPKSSFRMSAGRCVRDLGGPWAVSQLRAAIDAERDENIRKSLERDLVSIGQ